MAVSQHVQYQDSNNKEAVALITATNKTQIIVIYLQLVPLKGFTFIKLARLTRNSLTSSGQQNWDNWITSV